MPELLTCSRGHQWESEFDERESLSRSVVCPECGAELPLYEAIAASLLGSGAEKPHLPLAQRSDGKTPQHPGVADGGQGGEVEPPTVYKRKASSGAVPPVHIPGYEMLGELGRGGMGVVYKARQCGLNRIVSLKMILAADHAGLKERARFRHEGEVVHLWDAASGKEVRVIRGHTDAVAAVAFAPDGKRFASASHDRTIKLWDAATAQEVLTLKGHSGEVTALAFSGDGQLLASASMDQTIRVWCASPVALSAKEAAPQPASPPPVSDDDDATRLDVGRHRDGHGRDKAVTSAT